MADMLVRLYSLPDKKTEAMRETGVTIRRPLASEKTKVTDWIGKYFAQGWADECDVTFSRQPVSTFIAVIDGEIVGFASYDATCRNFFGPTGVKKSVRGKGVGEALLLEALHSMREQGYAYAIIGGVGPAGFYAKTVGAVLIEGSETGVYAAPLR